MADDNKSSFNLTTNQKIGLGVGAAALAIGGLVWWKQKKDAAAVAAKEPPPGVESTPPTQGTNTTTPTTPPSVTLEDIFTAAPALALDPAKLPVLRRKQDGTPGTYWVVGDGNATDFAMAFAPNLEPADAMGTSAVDNGIVNVAGSESGGSDTFIADFGARVQLQGAADLPPADAWIAVVGKDQAKYDVTALQQILTKMRAVLAAQARDQRIVWVLAKSAPGELAKALGSASEEWYRSRSDDPAEMAREVRNAVLVRNVAEAQQLFPPPSV